MFSGKQLAQLDGTTLADVIHRNTTDMLGGMTCGGSGGGAAPAAGVTVNLYDSSGNLVATTTTDARGNYKITGLDLGTYTVKATVTNGKSSNDYSRTVSLTRGIALTGVDLGLKIDLGGHYQRGTFGHGWDNGWFPWFT